MIIDYFALAGWAGMIFLISAYAMISFKKIKSTSKLFHCLNLLGGIGILVNAVYTLLFPVIVLNLFWVGISVYSLVKILKVKPVYKELS